MSDPIDSALPTGRTTVSVHVSLIEEADPVARVTHAIAAAGGHVRTLTTVRSVPEVEVVELALCIQDLDDRTAGLALSTVAGILAVGRATGAPMLERRTIRIGGRARWPGRSLGSPSP